MKDDKKKLMIVGALAVAMAGIGAFTFLGGGSAPPPVAVAPKPASDQVQVPVVKVDENGNVVATAANEEPPKNPLYAANLPQRDPFTSKTSLGMDHRMNPQPTPTARPVRQNPAPRSNYTIPPYSPISGSLPAAGGSVTLTPTGPDPSQFGYTVSGVITGGHKPAAVFTDSSGNQRLVPVGGSLDGDSKVLSVEKGKVTIMYRGKKQRLSLGGNPK